MENKIEIFSSEKFGSLRIIEEDGKILFVASDVAKMLGYANISKAISNHCRCITKRDIPHSQGKGTLVVNTIPESDIYRLIVHSNLPSIGKFENWIFDEVLPSIRKTDGYHIPTVSPEQLELMKLNAKARVAEVWLAISGNTQNQTYKDICNTYAANTLAEKEVFAFPAVTEKTYTATEIGKLLGVSANKIDRIAYVHGLKTSEYGKYFYDKSRLSIKEIRTFRYFKKAIKVFRKLLN